MSAATKKNKSAKAKKAARAVHQANRAYVLTHKKRRKMPVKEA
jgi:hypothetical protein